MRLSLSLSLKTISCTENGENVLFPLKQNNWGKFEWAEQKMKKKVLKMSIATWSTLKKSHRDIHKNTQNKKLFLINLNRNRLTPFPICFRFFCIFCSWTFLWFIVWVWLVKKILWNLFTSWIFKNKKCVPKPLKKGWFRHKQNFIQSRAEFFMKCEDFLILLECSLMMKTIILNFNNLRLA